VRYITNKPKIDVTKVTSMRVMRRPRMAAQHNVDATINLPVIDNTLAVRAGIYTMTLEEATSTTSGDVRAPTYRWRHSLRRVRQHGARSRYAAEFGQYKQYSSQ